MKKTLTLSLSAVLLAACAAEQTVAPAAKPNAPVKLPETAAQPLPQAARPHFNQSTEGVAQTGFHADANVQAFIRYETAQGKISEGALYEFFNGAKYKPNIISIMNRPGTSKPWYEFVKGNAGAGKISGGRKFYQTNRVMLDNIARDYGVPAELLVAIIGIETNYGGNSGSIRVADSLATLAFDYPRRSEFFQKELNEFLLLAQEEKRDPFSFTGSFAGAMGLPQFMPSSYRKWAVDYDGDGARNIWSSVPDAAASVANYMKVHGWQKGGRILVPAQLEPTPELLAIMDEKTELKYTMGELRQKGVTPQEEIGDSERVILFRLETAPGRYEYFLGLNNFYTVWQYNHSRMYVTAVRDIANGVGGGNL